MFTFTSYSIQDECVLNLAPVIVLEAQHARSRIFAVQTVDAAEWYQKSPVIRAYDRGHPGFLSEGLIDEQDCTFNQPSTSVTDVHLPTAPRIYPEPDKAVLRGFLNRRKSELHRNSSIANSLLPGSKTQDVSHTGGQTSDSLGLHLIYDVPNPHGDIIFVHGLGGNAFKTWCWNREEENFWPAWLPQEEGLESYRVFTYGYNSNFKGAATNLNVIDFAKGLLTQMLTSNGNRGAESTPIGNQPIIFIAHSMGGLVVKKAYVLGRNDETFAQIVSKIHGIIFLATPHRGAGYAKILNNILSATPLGAPPKAYIADLDTNSSALQDINEQFRSLCEELALVSFFETIKTSFGIHKVHIVDKSSGVLGYPKENSDALDADHHTICKYRDRNDGNYLSVKNMIKLWAVKISSLRPTVRATESRRNSVDTLKKIQSISGIWEPADEELSVNKTLILDGTCSWLTENRDFDRWIRGSPDAAKTTIFHLVGLPAAGKTIITSHVIEQLQTLGEQCQYHFFASGHQNKRTGAYCLRSIATQLAISDQAFRERLFHLHEETGVCFSSQDQNFNVIWDKVFQGIIFKMDFSRCLYWVFDGVDEADSPLVLLNSLTKIESVTPIRIFLSSRPLKIPMPQINGAIITTIPLTVRDTATDIRNYVQSAVRDFLPDEEKIQKTMVDQVLEKAEGSFLWVKLALDTLQVNWHTLDDIRESLTEVPSGMEPMYERMVELIATQPVRQKAMAKAILTWAVCSWRPLSIAELRWALQPDFKGFVKLEETVIQICGHFISIDNGRLSLIHATARQFLLQGRSGAPPYIDEEIGHEHIAMICLSYLSNDSWKRVFRNVESLHMTGKSRSKTNLLLVAGKDHHFLCYSSCYWAYHVSKASLQSGRIRRALNLFFRRFCLSWIEGIALSKNLRYLIRSAQYLKAYAKRKRRQIKANSPLTLVAPSEDSEATDVQLWAVDFIRIVGKFGHNLVQNPSAIHRLVPPFCPRDSMIGQVYGTSPDRPFSVGGLHSTGWDDCLAIVSAGDGKDVTQVLATDTFFITLRSGIKGPINTFYADTCTLARTMHHGEYIRRAILNKTRSLLATAGAEHYRVWDIATGESLYRKANDTRALPMVIKFGASDTELIVGFDDCTIRCFDITMTEELWRFTPPSRDEIQDSPKILSISPDLTKVAMAWRGRQPLLFDITSGISQVSRVRILGTSSALRAAERIEWQQDSSSVLILCESTKLVEWHVYDEEQHVYDNVRAREMTVSRDGDLLLTSDSAGNVSVWTFPRLHLIYRLENQHEFIRNISLSPDGQRVYKTTDNKCIVLEPDALVRSEEQELEDNDSTTESSLTTEPIIVRDESSQSRVTSLAYGLADKFYCAGRDDGTVRIHDGVHGGKCCTISRHDPTSSIIALHWSYSNRYIISGDDAGHLVAKRLQYRGSNNFKFFNVFDIRFRDPIHQLFMNENEQLLLISTSNTDEVWDMQAKQRLCQRDWGEGQGRQWVQHPSNPQLLIWIEPTRACFHEWRTLEQTQATQFESDNYAVDTDHASQGKTISWIALTSNKQYIIYLVDSGHPSTRLSSGLHLEFLSTSHFQLQHPSALSDDSTTNLASQIVRLVGTYQDRIVFLDHDYWLCTWQIDTGVNDVKRHFFLPKDWLSPSTLEMAALNDQGTFFCPKKGDVAIVRHGMRF